MLFPPGGLPRRWDIDAAGTTSMGHRCGDPPGPNNIDGPWMRFLGSEAGPVGLAGEAGALCLGVYGGKVPPPPGARRQVAANARNAGISRRDRPAARPLPGLARQPFLASAPAFRVFPASGAFRRSGRRHRGHPGAVKTTPKCPRCAGKTVPDPPHCTRNAPMGHRCCSPRPRGPASPRAARPRPARPGPAGRARPQVSPRCRCGAWGRVFG